MAERVLTLRERNRATLARQMLLGREATDALDAVERLAGLQAQVQSPPYIGLWTRLRSFRREDLTSLLMQRQVVRATLMRSTIHLMTAEDFLVLRPALQPALSRALGSFFGQRAKGLDITRLVAAAREFLSEEPRTFADLRTVLAGIEPDRDPEALAYAVRTHLPLVQVPTAGAWGFPGNPAYALAESRLGRPLADEGLRPLVRRYLAAFGPASVKDLQTWSGLARIQEGVERLKSELCMCRDEQGNELLDLPDMPLPSADTPAPPRFLPEYDNLLLAHADRSRVIAGERRAKVFLSAARVRSTFLVDGLVHGAWKIVRETGKATLLIEPFMPLDRDTRAALAEEAERLLHFVEDGMGERTVTFADDAP